MAQAASGGRNHKEPVDVWTARWSAPGGSPQVPHARALSSVDARALSSGGRLSGRLDLRTARLELSAEAAALSAPQPLNAMRAAQHDEPASTAVTMRASSARGARAAPLAPRRPVLGPNSSTFARRAAFVPQAVGDRLMEGPAGRLLEAFARPAAAPKLCSLARVLEQLDTVECLAQDAATLAAAQRARTQALDQAHRHSGVLPALAEAVGAIHRRLAAARGGRWSADEEVAWQQEHTWHPEHNGDAQRDAQHDAQLESSAAREAVKGTYEAVKGAYALQGVPSQPRAQTARGARASVPLGAAPRSEPRARDGAPTSRAVSAASPRRQATMMAPPLSPRSQSDLLARMEGHL